jgi:hypothetical protein
MEKLNVSGETLDQYLKAPVDEGNGYVGGLEVFHQIHCLVSAALFLPTDLMRLTIL